MTALPESMQWLLVLGSGLGGMGSLVGVVALFIRFNGMAHKLGHWQGKMEGKVANASTNADAAKQSADQAHERLDKHFENHPPAISSRI